MLPHVCLDAMSAKACRVRGQGIAFLTWSDAYTWLFRHGYRPADEAMREWRLVQSA